MEVKVAIAPKSSRSAQRQSRRQLETARKDENEVVQAHLDSRHSMGTRDSNNMDYAYDASNMHVFRCQDTPLETMAIKMMVGSCEYMICHVSSCPFLVDKSNPVLRSIGCPTLSPCSAAVAESLADPAKSSSKSIFPLLVTVQ